MTIDQFRRKLFLEEYRELCTKYDLIIYCEGNMRIEDVRDSIVISIKGHVLQLSGEAEK